MKVFACAKHGRCTVAKQLNGIARCDGDAETSKLILRNPLSPGDCLVMTAALECLHQQHPGRYLTAVESTTPAVFEHNPYVMQPDDDYRAKAELIQVHYPLIQHCNSRPVHFLQGYTEFLADKLDIPLQLTINRPCLYLTEQEKHWMPQVQEITGRPTKYWVINAGVKNDFTAKAWGQDNYQHVVDYFLGKILFVQVGAAEHDHRPLRGVLNLIGRTDARQLIRLCYHAQGGIGPTTFVQHIFAALEKPYVCILGAREPVSWTHYPSQRTLSTQGSLPCCTKIACWRSRTVKLGDGRTLDNSLCEQPVLVEGDPRPRCMQLISSREVIGAVEGYYSGGLLQY